jgi:hypothetical protein
MWTGRTSYSQSDRFRNSLLLNVSIARDADPRGHQYALTGLRG